MKIKQLRPEYVEFIPERIEEGVLYISERYSMVVHKCCCGCGQEVVTPLSPAEWSVKRSGGRVSLWPSIGNWDYPCRSHYVIRDNRVLVAEAMTDREIQLVKAKDRADKAAYVRHTNYAKEATGKVPRSNAKTTPDAKMNPDLNWLKHMIRWWKSLP